MLNFENIYDVFIITSYILSLVGIAIIFYVCFVFCLVTFSLARTKNLTPIKIIHIFSVIETYCMMCFLIAILFIAKVKGLIILKIIIFGLIVIFNGITVTRLVAKTAYFYNLRFKKSTKALQ